VQRVIVQADTSLVDAVHASPNIEPRKNCDRPDMLILHYTGMHSAEKAIDWLARPESGVSCHYVIGRDGRVTQMVAECMRAWHAGVSHWAGETDVNSRSIGIEIDNPGHELGYPDFPEPQMCAVEKLSLDIVQRCNIRPDRVLAHSDIAPIRKIDPGEKFDWARLARGGVGLWVEPALLKPGDTGIGQGYSGEFVVLAQEMLQRYGYGINVSGDFDHATEATIRAFQRHFRPLRADGRIDQSTITTLERLLEARDKLRANI
jgi:N-acetylmuramoyl-L-alanine amidase